MPRQPPPAPIDGALVINKPKGKTSHDLVDAVRHLAGFRQIGHLGTLDPLATGVLVLLLGRATRLVQFYAGRRKRYEAGFRFGFATNTYDSDGEAQGLDAAPALDAATVEKSAAERIGRFEQMPPSFSAKKVKGRPAYELARKKQTVELNLSKLRFTSTNLRRSTATSRALSLSAPPARTSVHWRTKWDRSSEAARTWRKLRAPRWESFHWNRQSRSRNSPRPNRPENSPIA